MFSRRALAIVNMLLFVMIFTILSGILLTLVSSHTRLLEHHIRRIKGYYAAEAGCVFALDALRQGAVIPANLNVEWSYNLAGSSINTKPITMANQPSGSTTVINATSDYTLNW